MVRGRGRVASTFRLPRGLRPVPPELKMARAMGRWNG